MKRFQTILTILALSLASGLVACSGGSSSGGGGGGSNPISVSLSGAPASMTVNGSAAVTATVNNDSANAGVTWSCAPSGSCGSFSPTITAGGTATTYTAPAAVPTSSVTVTATSVTDGTKSASSTITIGHIPLASGNYVFSLSGSNTNIAFYDVAGVFTVNGDAITGGEQDYVDNVPTSDLHDAINPTGSFVTTTADGNLQIVLTTCLAQDCTQVDSVIDGGNGIEVINGSLTSTSSCATAGGPCVGRLIEFDSVNTSSGKLELQDAAAAVAAPAGNYVFGIQGIGVSGLAVAIAGVLDISGASVSTSGTVFDVNNGGTASTAQTISTGSVGTLDATGRMQLSITPSATFPIFGFAAYIVDANHIRMALAASPLSGVAYLQNSLGLSVAGTSYVAGLNGFDGFGTFQAAGLLTMAQGANGVTGMISYNDIVNAQTSAIAVTGTYTDDVSHPGRAELTAVTDGTNTFDINLYVDGNGHALALTLDAGVVLSGEGFLQTPSSSFSGTYVMDATGADASNGMELDAVGPVTTGSGTFSGFADFNWLGAPLFPNEAVSGAFTAPVGGVSTGAGNTLTGLDALLGGGQADAFDYYVVDANTVIGIEVDSNQNTLATFDLTQ
jgi:hypothetical protein